MKAVMLSIQPHWCELIASGEKTLEVRKTRPKLKTPFRVYIYSTKSRSGWFDFGRKIRLDGMVIGEFVCDNIRRFDVPYPAFQSKLDPDILEKSCCTYYALHRYAYHDALYGWNISDLKIYDRPKKLAEFCKEGFEEAHSNWEDMFSIGVPSGCVVKYSPEPKKGDFVLKKPPQSWCYVEEI